MGEGPPEPLHLSGADTDFTGSAFIRTALYANTGGYQQDLDAYDATKLAAKAPVLWRYLDSLKPYLWRQGETYPESLAKLDQLYGDGEVWLSMHYDPAVNPARLPHDTQAALAGVDLGPATVTPAELAGHQLPEIDGGYVKALESGWKAHVAAGG